MIEWERFFSPSFPGVAPKATGWLTLPYCAKPLITLIKVSALMDASLIAFGVDVLNAVLTLNCIGLAIVMLAGPGP